MSVGLPAKLPLINCLIRLQDEQMSTELLCELAVLQMEHGWSCEDCSGIHNNATPRCSVIDSHMAMVQLNYTLVK